MAVGDDSASRLRRHRVVAEESLPLPQNERIDVKVELVDETGGEQLAYHLAAAVGDEVGTVLCLQLPHALDDIRAESAAFLPRERFGVMRGDVLGGAIERAGDRVVRLPGRDVGPVVDPDVVCCRRGQLELLG